MKKHGQATFAVRLLKTIFIAAVLCHSGGAASGQPPNPVPNVPLPPDPVETSKLVNEELRRMEESQKRSWSWISWIVAPGGAVFVLLVIHGVRIWGEHARAMKDLRDDEQRRRP